MNYRAFTTTSSPSSQASKKALEILALLGIAASAGASVTPLSPLPGSMTHGSLVVGGGTPVDPSEKIEFAICLKPRENGALEKFVDSVSDPASPTYRHFIGPDEVGQKFGPLQSDLDSAAAFLKSNGLTVTRISKNHFEVFAKGTAQQIQAAFRTKLVHSSLKGPDGKAIPFRTNVLPLQVPTSLVSKVRAIVGVDNSVQKKHFSQTTTLSAASFRSAYYAATAYAAGFYGQGTRIGIANWDGYRLDNVPYFTTANNLPVPGGGAGSNIVIRAVGSGTTWGQDSAYGEGDLDIQSVLIAAPLSTVYVYDDAESDDDAPVSTLSAISDDNAVDVMSESWGWATLWQDVQYASLFASAHDIHLSMSAQGITYFASSGDSGTQEFPQFGTRYAYPDIDEEVASVGGTVMSVDKTSGARWSERTWGLRGGWAGTGGFDPWDTPAIGYPYNVPPSYQKKYIGAKTGKYNYRLVPDFSAAAGGQDGLGNNDLTGWAISIYFHPSGYSLGSVFYFDGTSFASPASAGALAALEGRLFQFVKPNANRSNVRLGRIQDFLYSIGGNPDIFTDVVAGNSIGNLPGTRIPALPTKGWDFATGWGSPVFAGLYGYMLLSGKHP